MTNDHSQPGSPYPRRFGWGMRIFLVLFLFDMLYRSMFWTLGEFELAPLDVRDYPLALPSQAELESIDAGTHLKYTTRTQRYVASLRSAGAFAIATPEEMKELGEPEGPTESPTAFAAFASRWLMTRLAFLGHITGNDQTWQMFSHVSKSRTLPHVRLLYEDGSAEDYYGWSHPRDFTRISHWFEEKRLQAELNVYYSEAMLRGYSNWLVHHHGVNAAGSRLKTIEFSSLRFYRTTPGEDVRESLRRQSARPADQMEPVFWRYDVRTRTGRAL